MEYHALVIDNDQESIDAVSDILDSLGHTHDLAKTQQEAHQLLKRNSYAYSLLEMAIPVKPGRRSRKENGLNLLGQLRRTPGREQLPVIVMVGHNDYTATLAHRLMGFNARGFLKKPLAGDTLDQAILQALDQIAPQPRKAPKPDPEKFPMQGKLEMVFHPDRVDLCGIKICGGEESGQIRKILEALKEKDARGRPAAWSGNKLANLTGTPGGQNSIAGAIRDFRAQATQLMLEEAGITCGREDVIKTTKQGYRIGDKIVVNGRGQAVGEDSALSGDESFNPRQEWALGQLRAGVRLRAAAIAKEFGCSSTTAKRDLADLRRRGIIKFVGPARTGWYVLRNSGGS